MEREYTVGTWLTPSDEYIKDIKQALVEKGLATEETPNEELVRIVKDNGFVKTLFDRTKTCEKLFYNTAFAVFSLTEEVVFSLFGGDALENVTNMNYTFANNGGSYSAYPPNTQIKRLPLMNTSNVKTMSNTFKGLQALEVFPEMDTSNVTAMDYMLDGCRELITITSLNMISVTSASGMLESCKKLTNITLKNIKTKLQIGSGTSWGHLLTLESLINTCKECIKTTSSLTLTVGTANIEKLADVYVRFVDRNQTEIAEGEKGEVVVCEADNNDAMTITEYMALKSWTLA